MQKLFFYSYLLFLSFLNLYQKDFFKKTGQGEKIDLIKELLEKTDINYRQRD
jgi:hypothetical protein